MGPLRRNRIGYICDGRYWNLVSDGGEFRIEAVDVSVFAAHHDHFLSCLRRQQDGTGRYVPIMKIMRGKLMVASKNSGFCIQPQY